MWFHPLHPAWGMEIFTYSAFEQSCGPLAGTQRKALGHFLVEATRNLRICQEVDLFPWEEVYRYIIWRGFPVPGGYRYGKSWGHTTDLVVDKWDITV